MKKTILYFATFFITLSTYAQPLLVGGMTNGGTEGPGYGNGSIITYLGGATSLDSVVAIPSENTNLGPECATLTQGPDGKMYGLNTDAGAYLGLFNSIGSLFQYDIHTNTYRDLLIFDSISGNMPWGGLVLASDGLLYGLTASGGAHNSGTLFSYAVGDTVVTKLVDLPANANPFSTPIQASNGMLYGLTQYDGSDSGGTIFQYDIATATYTVVHNLPAGALPDGALLEVGTDTLYGETTSDGAHRSGTLFRFVTGANTYTVLRSFDTLATPSSGLAYTPDGTLWGNTYGDGANRAGTLFSFNIRTDSFKVLHNFGATATDGANPNGGPMIASNGMLYGMTNLGGVDTAGTIFQYDIATSTYTKMVDLFQWVTGGLPNFGNLTEYKTPLGIADIQRANRFSLYPDPTPGIFTITDNYSGTLTVQVINMLGEQMKEFTMTGLQGQFDISSLTPGIYQVQISDGRQTLRVLRVVKV